MYKVKHRLCLTKISELFHMHCTPYNLRVAPRSPSPDLRPRNMTNTRSLIWDLSWGIDYRAKLGPYRPPTSFKHRVQKCDLKCTWPVIGYTRIWYTGTSFLLKRLTGVRSLSPLTYPFVVVFFSAYIFLRLPHDLNACNRLLKTRLPYFRRAETWRL